MDLTTTTRGNAAGVSASRHGGEEAGRTRTPGVRFVCCKVGNQNKVMKASCQQHSLSMLNFLLQICVPPVRCKREKGDSTLESVRSVYVVYIC